MLVYGISANNVKRMSTVLKVSWSLIKLEIVNMNEFMLKQAS
jgi:hypothetical protein